MPDLHHAPLTLYLLDGTRDSEARPARRQDAYPLRLMDKPVMISDHRQIR